MPLGDAINPAVLLYSADGKPLAFTDGLALPAGQPALVVGGSDGANLRFLKTDTAGRPAVLIDQWIGSAAPTVGQKVMASSLPVTMASNQSPILIAFGLPGGGTTLPKMVGLIFDASDGAIVANVYKRILTWTVPAAFNAYMIRFTSIQSEAALSRVVSDVTMGTLSIVTNVFTAGTPYAAPQWTAATDAFQADVTVALTSASGNVVVTVGYTNQDGTAGRTGTFTIPKGSAIGSRWNFTPQAGDIGVRSIESMSTAPTLAAGTIRVAGMIQLAMHNDTGVTPHQQTIFNPGGVSFPTGTVIGIEFAGGTVLKSRNLDLVLQLLPV